MRIAILTFGGYGYYPHFLINSILDRQEKVLVLAPDNTKQHFAEIIGNDDRLSYFKQPRRRYPTNIFMVNTIVKAIEKFKPDVVHMTGYYPWMYFGLKRLSKFPIVLTVHDPMKHLGDIQTKIVPGSENWFYKYISRVIVLGEEMKRVVSSKDGIDESRIDVILHGNYSRYLKWSQNNIKETDNNVLFFGRIFKYKGLEYLVEAEPTVSNEVPNVQFTVAGTGSRRYINRVKKNIVHLDRFEFIEGYVSNERVARLYQQSSLVVLPYVDGTQSGPLLLSYAFKKPLIITNVGSLPEYVIDGNTGYIVPPKNSQELAQRIIELLKDKELRNEMGENGFEMSVKKLSWENLVEQYIKVYQKARAWVQ